jgi:hypothetical protein
MTIALEQVEEIGSETPQDFDSLTSEYATIAKMAETVEDRVDLTSELAFRVLIENRASIAKVLEYGAKDFTFTPGKDGNLYILPNQPMEVIQQVPALAYAEGALPQENGPKVDGFITEEGVIFAQIPQQRLVEYPAETESVSVVTISDCSVLVGKNAESLYISHVGYGETGNVYQVLNMYMQKGIPLSEVVAVITQGDQLATTPWHMPITQERLLEIGLQEGHVIERFSKFVGTDSSGDGSYGHNNEVLVTVTPNFVAARSFDYRVKETGGTAFDLKDDVTLVEL